MIDKPIKPEDCIVAYGIPTCKEDFFGALKKDDKDYAKYFVLEKLKDIKKTCDEKDPWETYDKYVIQVIRKVEKDLRNLGVKDIIHRCTLNRLGEIIRENRTKGIVLISHWKREHNKTAFTKQGYLDFLKEHPDFLEQIVHSRKTLEWLNRTASSHVSLIKRKLTEQIENGYYPLVELKNDILWMEYNEIVANHLKKMKIETFSEILENTVTSKVEFHDGLQDISGIVRQITPGFNGILDLNVCPPEALTHVLRKVRPQCHFKYKYIVPDSPGKNGVLPMYSTFFYRTLFQYLKENNQNYLDAYDEVSDSFINAKQGGPIEKIKRYFQRLFKKRRKTNR